MSPSIVTFLVTNTDSTLFRRSLEAALAQDTDHHLVIVDASQKEKVKAYLAQHPHLPHLSYIRTPGATNFAQAINDAIANPEVDQLLSTATYLWFLHHDSIAAPNALSEQLAIMESGASIAVVGPKHHGPNGEIYEVGISATRSGQRLETAPPDEIDQGQYDGRSDVLAVDTAGMLVQTTAWTEAQGFYPLISPYDDGLELCRRIRRAGYRVLVAPRATLTHHRESINATTSAHMKQRKARLHSATLSATWWEIPPYLLYFLLIQPLRALGNLLTLKPRQAAAELGAYCTWLIETPAVLKRKTTGRINAQVPHSALRSVELPWHELRQRRTWEKKHIERIAGQETHPLLLNAIHQHRRRYLTTLTTLLTLTITYALITWAPFLSGTTNPQNIITGPSWAGLPHSWAQLWDTNLHADNAGHHTDPIILLLTFLTAPFTLIGISPATITQILIVTSVPTAALSMWWASATISPRLGIRLLLALLWAAQPALLISAYSGHLASIIFHTALPAAAATMLRLLASRYNFALAGEAEPITYQRQHHQRWWGVTAILLFTISATTPGTLILVIIALIATTIHAHHNPTWTLDHITHQPVRSRLRAAWLSTLPAAILTAPHYYEIVTTRAWLLLLTPAGPTPTPRGLLEGHANVSALMLGLPSGTPQLTNLNSATLLQGITATAWIIAVILASTRIPHLLTHTTQPKQRTTIATLALGSLTLLLAAISTYHPTQLHHPQWHQLLTAEHATTSNTHLYGATFPALTLTEFTAAHHSTTPWTAPLLSITALCYITAYALTAQTNGRPAQLHTLLTTLSTAALLGLALTNAITPTPTLHLHNLNYGNTYSLPIAALKAQNHTHNDILIVVPTPTEIHTQRLNGNGPLLTDTNTISRYTALTTGNNTHQTTQNAIATLSIAPDPEAVTTLARDGIDSIATINLDTPEIQQLNAQLAQTPGIEPGAQTNALTLWRLRPHNTEQPAHTPDTPTQTPNNWLSPQLTEHLDKAHALTLATILLFAALSSTPLPARLRHTTTRPHRPRQAGHR